MVEDILFIKSTSNRNREHSEVLQQATVYCYTYNNRFLFYINRSAEELSTHDEIAERINRKTHVQYKNREHHRGKMTNHATGSVTTSIN
jgi:hypothetical protein